MSAQTSRFFAAPLSETDPELFRAIGGELTRQRDEIELMHAILFSLPGSPVLYYGDEIGMGDNVYLGDRNGVRTPMQWSGGWNAGFSTADPERLWLPLVSNAVYPLLVLTQSIPKVALAPILVVVLGSNELPRIVVTVLVALPSAGMLAIARGFPVSSGSATS